MTPHILIVGARGRLGAAAADAFAQAGWRVTAVARQLSDANGAFHGNVTWLRADLKKDRMSLLHQPGHLDAVLHAANPSRYTAVAWRQHALPMLQTSIAIAQQANALLMLPGNVYNYGPPMPALLTPDAPQQPGTALGRIRVEMEDALRQAALHGLRSVVVRAGNFFGGGTGSLLDRVMTTRLQRNTMPWIGHPDVATPWAYLPDLAQTFVAVAHAARSTGVPQAVHFSGHTGTAHDWRRVIENWAHQRDVIHPSRPLRLRPMPQALVRVIGWVNAEMASVHSLRHTYNQAHRLDNSNLTALIGAEPHTPFDKAVEKSLDALAPSQK